MKVNFVTKTKAVKGLKEDKYEAICLGFEESNDPVYDKTTNEKTDEVTPRVHILFELSTKDSPVLKYKVAQPEETIVKDSKLYKFLCEVIDDITKVDSSECIYAVFGALTNRKFSVLTRNTPDGYAWISSVEIKGDKINPADLAYGEYSWADDVPDQDDMVA